MAKHVGIDLGTTTSGLAYLRKDGEPEIVPNADGERLTPSVVFFDPYEDVKLVGSAARDGGDPNRTVFRIKNWMDDPEYSINIDGQEWTPTEISALILAKLKRECSRLIGPIHDVVITVPANFNELARKSTVAAAKIGGLNVTRLVNEPTAAALYYAHAQDVSGRVLVFDLGGGTLDVTVLEVDDEEIRILLSEGARHLGGNNFDDLLLDMYHRAVPRGHGTALYTDEYGRRRVLQSVEDAKKMLSKLKTVTDTIGNSSDGIARIELPREVFEEAITPLLTRTIMLVEQALDSVSMAPGDIDHVVLVGGSTRIPKVREVLKKKFGFEPNTCGNVDECVALGAALFAAKGRRVVEVCNHGYGTLAFIEDPDTGETRVRNSIVIPKNTRIPCSMSRIYVTSEDNEELIEVDVTQGEDSDPRYVDVIGKITLEVPRRAPGGLRGHGHLQLRREPAGPRHRPRRGVWQGQGGRHRLQGARRPERQTDQPQVRLPQAGAHRVSRTQDHVQPIQEKEETGGTAAAAPGNPDRGRDSADRLDCHHPPRRRHAHPRAGARTGAATDPGRGTRTPAWLRAPRPRRPPGPHPCDRCQVCRQDRGGALRRRPLDARRRDARPTRQTVHPTQPRRL